MKQPTNQILIAALAAALLLVSGCGAPAQSNGQASQEVSSSQVASSQQSQTAADSWQPIPPADAPGEAGTLQMVYTPKYAEGFVIEYYYGGAKIIVTDIRATAQTSALSQRLLLLPAGAAEPQAAYDFAVRGEVERIVTFASSHAGFFAALDEIGRISGSSIAPKSCFIPSLKAALEQGTTQYVNAGKNADKELIASLSPQVMTVGGMPSDVEIAHKMEESGIFCLYFGDFAEKSYMGRAEWIGVVGALCGKEQQAQDYMKENEQAVDEILARAALIEEKPQVLWFTRSSQPPNWSVRSQHDYAASMVKALGGEVVCPPTESNAIALSNEDFLPLLQQADRIVFGVSLNSYPDAKDMNAFSQEGQIDFTQSKAWAQEGCFVVGYDWAQDTANVRSIIASLAVALYPETFGDLTETGKILRFQP